MQIDALAIANASGSPAIDARCITNRICLVVISTGPATLVGRPAAEFTDNSARTLGLGSCGPHTEYKTLRIPKRHPKIHFRTENTDQNTKKIRKKWVIISYFFRILVCIFGSEVYFLGCVFSGFEGFCILYGDRMILTLGDSPSLVDISAPQKNSLPPPQFPNSPQTPSRPLGPSPSWRHPALGFSIKNPPPHPPAPRTLPSPSPSRKKIKNIRNVHRARDSPGDSFLTL